MNLSQVLPMIKTALLIAACLIAAVSDIRTGKVTNQFLLVLLGVSSIVIMICSLIEGIWPWEENGRGLLYVWNILLSCGVAIGFSIADIWAPGDAKLFIAIAILYPPRLQSGSNMAIFPTLQITVWMFSLGFLYLMVDAIFQYTKHLPKKEKKVASSNPNLRLDTFARMIMAYSFSLLVNTLLSSKWPEFYIANRILCILSVIVCCYLLGKLPRRIQFPITILLMAGVFLYPASRSMLISFSFGSLLPWIVAILIGFLTQRIRKGNYEEIQPDQLRVGMILSLYTFSRYPNQRILPQVRFVESRHARLNQEQVKAVTSWAKRKKEPILTVKMLPFAPFIAAGTILELTLGWLQLYR